MGPQCMEIANERKEIIIIVTSPMQLKLLKDDDLLSLLWCKKTQQDANKIVEALQMQKILRLRTT